MNEVKPLEHLAILEIDFDIWSGEVKLDDPDLKLGDGGKLPPKSLVQLGRKKVINPDHLKPFKNLKTKTIRLCQSYGMKLMNGYSIPLSRIDEVIDQLSEINAQMDQIKSHFLKNYEKWGYDWEQENPEYAQALQAGRLSLDKVASRFDFEYQVYQITAPNEISSAKLNEKARGLTGDLMREIQEEAKKFFAKISGKEKCQSTTQKTLLRLRNKVDGLSFLDSKFASVVDLLDESIRSFEGFTRAVEGEPFYRIMSIALILSDENKMEQYISGSIDVEGETKKYLPEDIKDEVRIDQSELPLFSLNDEKGGDHADSIPDTDDVEAFFQQRAASNRTCL